jgi:hypothetical protein
VAQGCLIESILIADQRNGVPGKANAKREQSRYLRVPPILDARFAEGFPAYPISLQLRAL